MIFFKGYMEIMGYMEGYMTRLVCTRMHTTKRCFRKKIVSVM